jgi:hypothetical protein
MGASKYKREELSKPRSTIYEIWDFDVRTTSRGIIREFLSRRSTLKVNEIWDFSEAKPQSIAKMNVRRHPRRLRMMVNALLIRLVQLFISS